MALDDDWKQLGRLLEEAAQAIDEAFKRGEEPGKDGRVRAFLDRANELRKRLGI